MKIVFVTTIYLPHVGGIEIYIHEIAQYLINQKHEVTIIVADKTYRSVQKEKLEGEKIIRIPAREMAAFSFLKNKNDMKQIEEEVKDADVVHVNVSKFLFGYFAKNKRKYNYRLVVSSHGWIYHTKKNKFIKDLFFKYVIAKNAPFYDAIINVSSQDQEIAKSFGIQNSCVIKNGVDIHKYSGLAKKNEYEGRFVYWGRIAENKGIYECLKKLKYYDFDYVFDIIGSCEDENYEKKLKKYLIDNDMQKKIHFPGRLSDDEVRNYLEHADFVLLPSLHEGFGMTLVECLLSGRPIIANANAAFTSILKSVDAEEYLFDFEDEKTDLKEKIEELRNTKIEPQNVEQYSIEKMIQNTLNIYGVNNK